MTWSVIIPAYNAEHSLAALLGEVRRQCLQATEIIVVDDGSTDGTARVAAGLQVRCVEQANAGPATARNRGAALATGDILIFLDSDLVPDADLIARLTAPLVDPTIDAVQGTMRTRQTELIPRYCQAEIEHKQRRCRRVRFVDSIAAGIFAIRRSVFEQYGGFCAQFRMAAAEDTDLSYRMAEDGRRILFCPEAFTWHPQPRTLGSYIRLKFWRGYWRALLYRRHPAKIINDSYTSHWQKVQVAGAALSPAWLAAVWWVAGWPGMLAAIAFMTLTTAPAAIDIGLRLGPPAALITPLMQFAASWSLGLGLLAGSAGCLRRRCRSTRSWQRTGKRIMDFVGAGLGVVLFSPVLLVVAVLIKATSPGTVFFVQTRSGRNGQPFPLLKFRTMTAGNHVSVGAETLANDPRITSIGQWLRRTGLDELPELFNVLRGEMSLVGPRPLLAWENEMCNTREARRLLVKPGITGLSQINGRNAIPWHLRVERDVRYVEQASLHLDLWILLRTVPIVLCGANAYAPPGCDVYADEPFELTPPPPARDPQPPL